MHFTSGICIWSLNFIFSDKKNFKGNFCENFAFYMQNAAVFQIKKTSKVISLKILNFPSGMLQGEKKRKFIWKEEFFFLNLMKIQNFYFAFSKWNAAGGDKSPRFTAPSLWNISSRKNSLIHKYANTRQWQGKIDFYKTSLICDCFPKYFFLIVIVKTNVRIWM